VLFKGLGQRDNRSLPFTAFKDLSAQDEPGTVEAIVSVFNNKDFAGEVVMPGAFANSLAKKLPRAAWTHNWEKLIGKTVSAFEMMPGDPRLPLELMNLGGLYVKGKLNLNTTDGKDAYEHLKAGDVDEFSIGYKIVNAHRVTQEGERVEATPFDFLFGGDPNSTLYLDELDLLEWSPVLAGMNDRTQLIGVKSNGPIVDLVGETESELFGLLAQVRAYAESRTKEGRTFSTANYAKLEGFAGRLEEMAVELRGLLGSAGKSKEPPKEPDASEPGLVEEVQARKLRADFERTRFNLTRILINS
jgi:HK97 family phage prohead protease